MRSDFRKHNNDIGNDDNKLINLWNVIRVYGNHAYVLNAMVYVLIIKCSSPNYAKWRLWSTSHH